MSPDARQSRWRTLAAVAAAAFALACGEGGDPDPRLRSVAPGQGTR